MKNKENESNKARTLSDRIQEINEAKIQKDNLRTSIILLLLSLGLTITATKFAVESIITIEQNMTELHTIKEEINATRKLIEKAKKEALQYH